MKKLIVATMLSFITALCYAAPINLYDQDKPDAKVTGTIDPAKGMVPIFTPPNSTWMKVGDSKTGNVGWIKTADLSGKGGEMSSEFTVTQHTISTPKGPKTYQVVQFGVPEKPQTDDMIKQIQQHQQQMQKMMHQIFQDMGNWSQWNSLFNQTSYPVFIPVIVLPDQTKPLPPEAAPKK